MIVAGRRRTFGRFRLTGPQPDQRAGQAFCLCPTGNKVRTLACGKTLDGALTEGLLTNYCGAGKHSAAPQCSAAEGGVTSHLLDTGGSFGRKSA